MDSGNKNDNAVLNSMKNLKIDVPPKVGAGAGAGNEAGAKEGSDATSCISSADATANSVKGSEADQEALMGDQGMYYYGYSYPGYGGSYGELDDWKYYMAPEIGDNQPSAVQTDNGSLLYYLPGYQNGYLPYSPVMPGAYLGADGQYYGQQSYYPATMLQQPLGSPGFSPQSFAYGPEMVPAYSSYSSNYFGTGVYVDPAAVTPKPSFSSRSQSHPSSRSSNSSKSTPSEMKGPSLGSDVKPVRVVPKQPVRPLNKGVAPVFSKGFVPATKIPSYTNQGKGRVWYPNSPVDVKESRRIWVGPEKVKARDGFNEFDLPSGQNYGPRTNSTKNSNSSADLGGSPDNGKNNSDCFPITTERKDMYNLPDFPTDYDHACFFVIKSYSEDDVHKSIKYNVWASTPNGNRRLDSAFQLAQQRAAEKGGKCPVFLFFSVNTSGQFCGVAEMVDRVNFDKSMDFWQQDKWTGFFPVKWHIIKDIQNSQFRHILLENNENKPVTNSRDTQEVKYPQGVEMLKIFKNFALTSSILDDFEFYEARQKVLHQKRSKPSSLHYNHPPPMTGEVPLDTKPDDLKPISVQSSKLEAGEVEGQLPEKE